VTMVCANHRGPPVRPDQKKRGTSCKYTVIARKFGGKWCETRHSHVQPAQTDR
jgi:hypothetical protein